MSTLLVRELPADDDADASPTTSTSEWPDLAKISHFGNILKALGHFQGLFSVWKKFEPILAIRLCYWVNFHCYIEQII